MTIPVETTIYLYSEVGGDKPPPLRLLVTKDGHTRRISDMLFLLMILYYIT